jgi:hypothetical protein
MSINRDINGVTDFLFDQIEEVDGRKDMEFDKKLRAIDTLLKHVWKAAGANLAYKQMMLRAPDMAQNREVVLQLGNAADGK